ncbi:MAG TPA: hypothetical protein VKX17_24225 [Planctomycetota bacterium]|nr:hypothetical protein [Planctomycetota bacterium]
MKIEIDKNLGVHICSQCKSALQDAEFVLCGIRIDADEPIICIDFVCPKCKFNGRYTMSFIEANPSFCSALEKLKDIVCDQEEFKRTRNPPVRLRGNRFLDDFSNEF